MTRGIKEAMVRGVGLTPKEGGYMVRRVKGVVERDNGFCDLCKFINPTTIILEGINFISSSPVKGRSIKEFSISTPINEPVNFVFKFSEFIFLVQDIVKLFGKGTFQLLKKGASWVGSRGIFSQLA